MAAMDAQENWCVPVRSCCGMVRQLTVVFLICAAPFADQRQGNAYIRMPAGLAAIMARVVGRAAM
jgi:hypothetical protein